LVLSATCQQNSKISVPSSSFRALKNHNKGPCPNKLMEEQFSCQVAFAIQGGKGVCF